MTTPCSLGAAWVISALTFLPFCLCVLLLKLPQIHPASLSFYDNGRCSLLFDQQVPRTPTLTTTQSSSLSPQRSVEGAVFHTKFLYNKAKIFGVGIVKYLIKHISPMCLKLVQSGPWWNNSTVKEHHPTWHTWFFFYFPKVSAVILPLIFSVSFALVRLFCFFFSFFNQRTQTASAIFPASKELVGVCL